MNFGQVLTALVTPFDNEGKIDLERTSILIEYLLDNGTDGLVVAGTTGESPTLTNEEKVVLFTHVVKQVNKRVPVIAGTGSNDTAASIQLTKEAERCGVDGIMLVAPYYNKPSQQGMYEHFAAIAKETNLPIMLYNIPGRSAVNMTAETIIQLSMLDNIVSVKEASGDLDQVSEIINSTADDFSVYSGDDGLTLPMLALGADGVVSVASHIIGNEMKAMVNHFLNGNTREAATIHRNMLPVMNGLFTAPNPSPVKAALQMKGIETGGVRLPLVRLTDEEMEKLKLLLEG
ncbi:4-hydroxy-tetrahydrodipicolinate synthase [Oceanobacillus saliphilus]|uniref:4-hydroxy-tetrahydrodipicolinate synthase n=1 Tax=Oceanobacillus saliphilus TaxID=2925834 RepID=UPI00201DA6BA|nr:4-hydroxy-tetrahydrodipicolinate synthase [Oceanobacillus saliphilus]